MTFIVTEEIMTSAVTAATLASLTRGTLEDLENILLTNSWPFEDRLMFLEYSFNEVIGNDVIDRSFLFDLVNQLDGQRLIENSAYIASKNPLIELFTAVYNCKRPYPIVKLYMFNYLANLDISYTDFIECNGLEIIRGMNYFDWTFIKGLLNDINTKHLTNNENITYTQEDGEGSGTGSKRERVGYSQEQ